MAQEQAPVQMKTPWTKIFTAFKVALDLKKLALAAVGIFCMSLGWWVIGWTFYNMRSFPEWKHYENKEKADEVQAQWKYFKSKRNSWNLLHELAGSKPEPVDAADVTDDLDVYLLLWQWEDAHKTPVVIREKMLEVGKLKFAVTPVDKEAETALANLPSGPLTVTSITRLTEVAIDDKKVRTIEITTKGERAVRLNILDGDFEELRKLHANARLDPGKTNAKPETVKAAREIWSELVKAKVKPAGKLRSLPWFEDRGPNPYLVVAEAIDSPRAFTAKRGNFLDWLLTQQAPVVLEPMFKFLAPVVFFFDARAGWWDRLYLVIVLMWTLAVWGFFGGAICRIAAVQVARNERISLAEAISFTRERCVSYIAAPLFPLLLVAIFIVLLILFGWVIWVPWLGDLFAGLLWPVVILLGFIMAIVLVGLVGWPLMIATISVEGNDSFDALSRSYSYVYQAPWQYLWYNFLAVVYGAVLIFFVVFMASMMVFLGKWGVASAPGPASTNPANDRDPSYLFYYAPTSFGWRDLMISGNPHVTKTEAPVAGRTEKHLQFSKEYENSMSGVNLTAAFLVAAWIYPLFLLVVGFGYSFFWSASTIIYFLMRHQVDDTDLDEVHMEDEDLEDPFMKPTPAATTAPPAKPGVVSLNVVDAPPPTSIRADDLPPPPAVRADEPPPPPPPFTPPPETPPSSSNDDGTRP